MIKSGNDDSEDLYGGAGNDFLDGGKGNDSIIGVSDNDTLLDGSGNGNLTANKRKDRVIDGAGNDTLIGGSDGDFLYGGEEADLFMLQDVKDTDYILDFDPSVDKLSASNDLSYENLTITGDRNSLISYEDNQLAIVLGVAPSELSSDNFQDRS